eukprot:scaffold158758_cov21-Tisochrysis_lutea.AAC.2
MHAWQDQSHTLCGVLETQVAQDGACSKAGAGCVLLLLFLQPALYINAVCPRFTCSLTCGLAAKQVPKRASNENASPDQDSGPTVL